MTATHPPMTAGTPELPVISGKTAEDKLKADRKLRQARYLAQSVVLEETGPSIVVRMAMLVVCALVVGFVLWAHFTTVKEVAVAGGEVVPSSSVQFIEHRDGGTLREIRVEKGQLVEAGEVLARLDPLEVRAELARLQSRRANLALKAERLRAVGEDRSPDFTFVGDEHRVLASNQREVYRLQLGELRATEVVYENQFERNLRQQEVLNRQRTSLENQIRILSEQRTMRQELVDLGLGSKLTFLQVEQEIQRLEGEVTQVESELGVTQEDHDEIASRQAQELAAQRRLALDEVGEVNAEMAETDQLIKIESGRLDRLEIRAPTRGLLQEILEGNPGSVLDPGQSFATLVPIDDILLVEARILNRDVGHVEVGQEVSVKVTTYDYARYGAVTGELVRISPTTFVDEASGETYYKGSVELDQAFVGDDPGRNPILPGMLVEADIVTGDKSVLAYLMK
ncbi:MAG: HlyD family type I secretion periplasmic adaptor subunit, partial [Rhodospirillaceae bacterium]